jgi:hypothetical protein
VLSALVRAADIAQRPTYRYREEQKDQADSTAAADVKLSRPRWASLSKAAAFPSDWQAPGELQQMHYVVLSQGSGIEHGEMKSAAGPSHMSVRDAAETLPAKKA